MTTSFELSKALFEKGVKIETERWWIQNPTMVENALETNFSFKLPAYATDELLAIMPDCLDQKKEYYKKVLYITKTNGLFTVSYYETGISYQNKSIAEALGMMCLWLLNNGFLGE